MRIQINIEATRQLESGTSFLPVYQEVIQIVDNSLEIH